MSEQERSALLAKLMAATSVLALSLGMTAQAADQHKTGDLTVTQHKGETGQQKLESGFLKHNTGSSDQIKWNQNPVNQGTHVTPSTELNPQPEPPKPSGDQTPKH